jgi:hypothetical protein
MSLEEIRAMQEDIRKLTDSIDITPEQQFQIAEDFTREKLEEEAECMDG